MRGDKGNDKGDEGMNKDVCPLKFVAFLKFEIGMFPDDEYWKCEKEKCAWWIDEKDTDKGKCAITAIGENKQ